jgi:hypothetical protein
VELSPRTAALLDELVELDQLNKTTVVNRAIQVYSILRNAEANDGEILIREKAGAELQRTRFL